MKRLSLFLIPLLTISFTSCDGISPEAKNAFVGEYWMETTYDIKNGNEVVDSSHKTKWSPVFIYEEKGKLFVHTNWYGTPYLSDDREHARFVEESNERPEFISQRRMPSDDTDGEGDSGIENVEPTSGGPVIVMMNGFIYTIRNGAYIMSETIAVKSGSAKVLQLEKCTPFKITLTDPDGTILTEPSVWFEYGAITNSGAEIAWQVELDLSNMPEMSGQANFDRVVYKNKLYKK